MHQKTNGNIQWHLVSSKRIEHFIHRFVSWTILLKEATIEPISKGRKQILKLVTKTA